VTPSPTALLQARNITKRFGDAEVLRGVDLVVAPRELVFLIGPSGSGKSTLLRCCNLLERPTSGSVRFEDIDLLAKGVDLNKVRQRLGMVFQHFNLYPHLTALGNVTLALRKALRFSRLEADRLGLETLDRVGLRDKANALPAELSGGQQQRVAIARTLALKPSIILMDEPTSALDPELVESVLQVVRALREDGMTMVIASHEMRFARDAADRVLFMDKGTVVEEGTATDIFNNPRHERTQRFLSQVVR